MLNLIFLRYWLAWIRATGSALHHFISMATFAAFMVKDAGLLLLILLFGSRPARAMHAQVHTSGRASWSRRTAAPRCMAWS